MALFRRRSTEADPEESSVAPDVDVDSGSEADAAEAVAEGYDRSSGPFDESEADLADAELTRIDLGSLRIPGLSGIGVQVEADQASGQIHAITAVADEAAVQLQPFAAPRSEGLWDEIRAEMLAELSATKDARVVEAVGAFGPELRAIVPARTPEGQMLRQPIRFAGIDGPRWFLRLVFLGREAVEPDVDDDLHQLIRQTVVVRGAEAMAPRDPLPLRLPEAEGEAEGEGDAAEKSPSIDPFTRGPEITEVR